jgi:predicted O-methyltransferase YrrM
MKRWDRLSVPVTVPFEGKRKKFLKHLIENNNFQIMIEVGIDTGKTTFFLLDNIPHLKIYAIDTDIRKFYNNSIKEKYGDRLIPMEGYSHEVADQLPDNFADIVFIDADHSYDAVKKDIVKYTPKLKKNGLLTGHDIDYPGVNKAVNEMIKDFDVGPNYVWIKKIKVTK